MKVAIELTDDGYGVTAEVDGQTFSEKWKLTPTGAIQLPGNTFEDSDLDDDVVEALESILDAVGNLAYWDAATRGDRE
ncbi:hypothetical protein [Alicyclobacillus sp. ALC3]|uniref:hypothetical protein n=1 Tax=Alicyclobacillus sp. ALC3 TaxID=2796143 RepID=UPI002378BBAC|nr:hypothetical protein [Alicyclobacillus sp. ALC3]WDL96911.1 hypothetical protein JC200_21970 [Alicyclobacillus sp. ALC3]